LRALFHAQLVPISLAAVCGGNGSFSTYLDAALEPENARASVAGVQVRAQQNGWVQRIRKSSELNATFGCSQPVFP
jgi:hypothetical protein